MQSKTIPDASKFIDIARYPINARSSDGYGAMMENIKAKLAEDGCAVLKGFVKPEAIAKLLGEAEVATPNAHKSTAKSNAYFSSDDETLEKSHPRRRFYERSNGFIPADSFKQDSALRAIYEWQPFFEFVREALDEPVDKFFRYADPLADVIVNMAGEGNGFPWHFDTNNYTVTLAIQNADAGGDFEYAANIRQGNENFDTVRDVLDGKSDLTTSFETRTG